MAQQLEGKAGRPPNSLQGRATPSLVLVGASFRTAGVPARERMARRLSRLPAQNLLRGNGGVLESAVLQTCNRVEIYLVCHSPDRAAKLVVAKLGGNGSSQEGFYVKKGPEALEHILRVASGLDSPVLGEEQILDQVREAGKTARVKGQAKSVLSALFDAAYSSGKRIRGSYRVSPGNKSLSEFALGRALRVLGHRPSKVLLIGSGDTAKLAALKLKGSAVYLVSARRAVEARFPGAVGVSPGRLREIASKCDLIIAATRRRGYALTREDLHVAKKVVILDLGFPRNVDPEVRNSKNATLFDLDTVADWALSKGLQVDEAAERVVRSEARRFDSWLRASRLTPTLANIYKWAERVRNDETSAALRKLPDLSAHDRTVVEALSRRLTGKLLSPHAAFAKKVGTEGVQSERLLLLESIFKEGDK